MSGALQGLLSCVPAAGGGGGGIAFDPLETYDDVIFGATSPVVLSNSDRTATRNGAGGYAGAARATVGKSTGKWYIEFSADVANTDTIHGLVLSTFDANTNVYVGGTSDSWGYWRDGSKVNNSSFTAFGATYTSGDVIGVAWDADAGKLWWAKNNSWQASGNPAAGTNPAFTSVTGTGYPAADLFNGLMSSTIRASGDYSYSPPSGFSAWG